MSKETEQMLQKKKEAQMDRLREAFNKTYDVVYNTPGMSDDPAGCKDHPEQCRKPK